MPKSEEAEFLRIAEHSEGFRELLKTMRFVEDPSAVGSGFVDLYHVDSEVGLRLFADTVRRHGLDKPEALL